MKLKENDVCVVVDNDHNDSYLYHYCLIGGVAVVNKVKGEEINCNGTWIDSEKDKRHSEDYDIEQDISIHNLYKIGEL